MSGGLAGGGNSNLAGGGNSNLAGGANSNSAVDGGLTGCGQAPQQLFLPQAPFNQKVNAAALDAESDAIIAYLADNHDTSVRFQIDFSLTILSADASVPKQSFSPTEDHYSPDCDLAAVPLPAGGSIEGEQGYECTTDGDCHLIVVAKDECRLYEMWRANKVGDDLAGGCLAVWQLDQAYPETGRGQYCTSADAAGLPIAPLTFTADEVAAGVIPHALRFILPNEHIRSDVFVHPGTHSTSATGGPDDAPPYSARLRLKANVDLSSLSSGAQVVAQALKDYGMYLADGGNLTFTGASDINTEHSWDEVGLTAQDLKGLEWSDFEVVELGERIAWSDGECQRTPIE